MSIKFGGATVVTIFSFKKRKRESDYNDLKWMRPFFTLSALFVCINFTQVGLGCGLPICDVRSELKVLEEKGQAYRFQFISKLRNDFGKEKEEAKLNNLLLFAGGVVELIARLNDEDYVLREAKALKDQILFALVQWVWRDCQRLSAAYSELASDARRYAALDFFLRRVGEFKSEDIIRNLVCFAGNAEATSRRLDDADYISRHALSLASSLSTQLLEVFNGWEGAFQLTVIDGPLQEEIDKLKLILFSSGGDLGIVAALTHPTIPPMVFKNVSFQGQPQSLISRQSFASQVPSVIELNFDENFEMVSGTVLEPIALKKTRFEARRIVSIRSFSNEPCAESELLGQYYVTLAGHSGTFSLEKIGTEQYAGVFSTPSGEFRLPFAFGKYNASTGRLTFVNMQANIPLAWRLSAERGSDSRCLLTGWGISAFNSASYPLILRKQN
jgi:hypothetical protein